MSEPETKFAPMDKMARFARILYGRLLSFSWCPFFQFQRTSSDSFGYTIFLAGDPVLYVPHYSQFESERAQTMPLISFKQKVHCHYQRNVCILTDLFSQSVLFVSQFFNKMVNGCNGAKLIFAGK